MHVYALFAPLWNHPTIHIAHTLHISTQMSSASLSASPVWQSTRPREDPHVAPRTCRLMELTSDLSLSWFRFRVQAGQISDEKLLVWSSDHKSFNIVQLLACGCHRCLESANDQQMIRSQWVSMGVNGSLTYQEWILVDSVGCQSRPRSMRVWCNCSWCLLIILLASPGWLESISWLGNLQATVVYLHGTTVSATAPARGSASGCTATSGFPA